MIVTSHFPIVLQPDDRSVIFAPGACGKTYQVITSGAETNGDFPVTFDNQSDEEILLEFPIGVFRLPPRSSKVISYHAGLWIGRGHSSRVMRDAGRFSVYPFIRDLVDGKIERMVISHSLVIYRTELEKGRLQVVRVRPDGFDILPGINVGASEYLFAVASGYLVVIDPGSIGVFSMNSDGRPMVQILKFDLTSPRKIGPADSLEMVVHPTKIKLFWVSPRSQAEEITIDLAKSELKRSLIETAGQRKYSITGIAHIPKSFGCGDTVYWDSESSGTLLNSEGNPLVERPSDAREFPTRVFQSNGKVYVSYSRWVPGGVSGHEERPKIETATLEYSSWGLPPHLLDGEEVVLVAPDGELYRRSSSSTNRTETPNTTKYASNEYGTIIIKYGDSAYKILI